MRKTVLFLLFLVLTSGFAYAQGQPLITSIKIQGLNRIEEGAVRSKISEKVGEPLSEDKISADIKTIYKLGYFDDVKVEAEPLAGGIELIYVLKEKPTILEVDFQGNKKYKDSKLQEKITVTPGSIADTVLIQDNAVRLKKFYEDEGYWLANVVPVLKKLSENDVTLTYQINEGPKIKIRKIIIEGNKHISSSKIKGVMKTSTWWLFSFITSSGYYKKDEMQKDVGKIRDLYFDHGYIQAVVGEPEIKVNRKTRGMTISIKISEGDQYRISSVDVTGNKAYSDKTIRSKITVRPGSIFDKSLLEKDIRAISTLYMDNGYALVSVVPDLVPNEKNKTVRVSLTVNEGDLYRVGRIEVIGNTKTRDKVIRREMTLDEGDIFDSAKIRRSYQRINNLNYFNSVDIVPKPEYKKKVVDLDVKVKERSTDFLSVGGGYSSVDKFIATADLTLGNLFGTGRYLKIKGELGGVSSLYEVSYRDPWFLDKPIALSVGVYRNSREYIEYDERATGGYISLGKRFSDYWSANIGYNYERATIYNISEGSSPIIVDQMGTNSTSSIAPSIVRDSRDNYLDPSRGSRNSLTFTFAGLGGTNQFVKGVVDSAWYFPLGDTSFMVRGRFGYSRGLFNKTLPLYERFYVGGIYTVRGLGFGDAGPKDPATGDAIGGTTELIFNTEYVFPILSAMRFKGVVFFDAGNSYEDFQDFGRLRYTTGAGIRWISPMGPIRVEWGYNLDRKPGESASKIEFAFGSFF